MDTEDMVVFGLKQSMIMFVQHPPRRGGNTGRNASSRSPWDMFPLVFGIFRELLPGSEASELVAEVALHCDT